jgi:hypothetical protein
MNDRGDVERLTAHIGQVLGPPSSWSDRRGEWPGQVELALLDAVFSMRAHHGAVRNVIARWCDRPDAGDLDDLTRLAAWSSETLADQLANHQPVPGGSQTKAAAVVVAARNLVSLGVTTAAQVVDEARQRRAYCEVPGLGPTTWTHFVMLVGTSDVKADTIVRPFVASALPERRLDTEECHRLVTEAAAQLKVSATLLDRAIWDYQRRQRA